MSSKETNLKEKFRIALNSTAKVISDDFETDKKKSRDKKINDIIACKALFFIMAFILENKDYLKRRKKRKTVWDI